MERPEILNRLAATKCESGDLGRRQLRVIHSARFKVKLSAGIAGNMTPERYFSVMVK